jgi:hypothetical protein
LLVFLKKLVAVLVLILLLALVMVDDPQDLDEAEGGSQPPQGRLLVGVDFGHGPASYGRGGSSRRAPRCRYTRPPWSSSSSTSRSQ